MKSTSERAIQALKETTCWFLFPCAIMVLVGKGFAEYIFWSFDITREVGLSGLSAILIAMAPLVAAFAIVAFAIFYWISGEEPK